MTVPHAPHGAAGNYGILDVIEALKWVKANIAAFGGDPDRITVFGESAGAIAANMVLISPLAKGLVQRAILQSPGSMRPMLSLEEAAARGDAIGKDIDALRAMSAEDLLALQDGMVPSVRQLTSPIAIGPIVDGWVVPMTDTEAYATGAIDRVPLIVGSNADEGGIFIHDWPIKTVDEMKTYLRKSFGDQTDEVMRLYGINADPDVRLALAAVFGDTQFNFGVRGIARGMSAVQPQTWRYLFTRVPGGEGPSPTHTEEIGYAFANLDAPRGVPRKPDNADDRKISDLMASAWVRFAESGDPNGGGLVWPAFREAKDTALIIDQTLGIVSDYRQHYLDWVGKYLAMIRR